MAYPSADGVSPEEITNDLVPSEVPREPEIQTLDAAPAVGGGELPSGSMIGEYRIEDRVGHGAMGVVYGAVHPVIGKRAAVKVMRSFLSHSPEAIERFVQEARAVGRIGHPNIVDAFAFGVLPDGRCYFIMEWLKGCPLSQVVKRGPLPIMDAIDVLDQVCRALEAAHAHGIIHRDLKPDNVFLQTVIDSRPVVKLLDFSIAKLADDEGARRHLTRTGVMVGTPAYVSPEQVRGAKVDARTDVYALGVMTFEMLTGQLPFNPENRMALLFMHLNDTPPPASSLRPEVPPVVDALLGRMLAKQPELRPSPREIREVVHELRQMVSAPVPVLMAMPTPAHTPAPLPTPLPAPPAPLPTPVPHIVHAAAPAQSVPPERPERVVDKRLVAAGVLAAAAVLVAVLTVLFAGGRDTPTPAVAAEPVAPMQVEPAAPAAVDPPPPPTPPPPTALSIAVDAPEAIIVVDGRIVGDSVKKLNLVLDEPGRHDVEVTAPGRRPFRKSVTVPEGQTISVQASLDEEGGARRVREPRPRPTKKDRVIGPAARVERDRPNRRDVDDDDDGTINPYPRRK